MPDRPVSATDFLAAERTFLAWIRTGLALMGFGFVVARFGLFLQTLQSTESNLHIGPQGSSVWFGTGLIVLGVVVNVVCSWNHFRLIRDLNRGIASFKTPSWLALSVALLLALVGLAMAIYLISVRQSGQANLEQGERSMAPISGNGIVTIPSRHSVEETVVKLQDILRAKAVKLFALVDHSGEAEKVGMQMRPTKLLIFGSPKAGTPLMIASPSVAIDLPLKILVWEDAARKTWISYNGAQYLQTRHNLNDDLMQNIAIVETLAAKAAE